MWQVCLKFFGKYNVKFVKQCSETNYRKHYCSYVIPDPKHLHWLYIGYKAMRCGLSQLNDYWKNLRGIMKILPIKIIHFDESFLTHSHLTHKQKKAYETRSLYHLWHSQITLTHNTKANNSPVSNSSWLLNRSTEDSFIQGQARCKVKYSQIPARRCLNLSSKQ